MFSTLTQTKSKILEDGIAFTPYDLFKDLDNKEFKLKKIKKLPVSNGSEVYDISNDKNLIPAEMVLKDETSSSIVKLRYNIDSPITLNFNNGIIELYESGTLLNLKCDLVKIKRHYKKKRRIKLMVWILTL
jgi:hypothetical protein